MYPLHDCCKIVWACGEIYLQLTAKTWGDSLKGSRVMGWRRSGYPQIFSLPQQQTVCQIPKHFRGAGICSRSFITMSGLMGLRNTREGVQKFLFECLSVTLLNSKVLSNEFAQKALEFKYDFDIVG